MADSNDKKCDECDGNIIKASAGGHECADYSKDIGIPVNEICEQCGLVCNSYLEHGLQDIDDISYKKKRSSANSGYVTRILISIGKITGDQLIRLKNLSNAMLSGLAEAVEAGDITRYDILTKYLTERCLRCGAKTPIKTKGLCIKCKEYEGSRKYEYISRLLTAIGSVDSDILEKLKNLPIAMLSGLVDVCEKGYLTKDEVIKDYLVERCLECDTVGNVEQKGLCYNCRMNLRNRQDK
jgi:hypothetical protein